MGDGRLSDDDLARWMRVVHGVPGDFAEVGVYRADLFNRLAQYAKAQWRIAHAFDSFAGMAPPGDRDGEHYPIGAMSVGGVEAFRALLTAPEECVKLWPGYIPECFEGCEAELAFAYIDVDHLEPTECAIRWAWPRIVPGGVIGFDDYFPGRGILASPAIDAFCERERAGFARVVQNANRQLFVVKRVRETAKPRHVGVTCRLVR